MNILMLSWRDIKNPRAGGAEYVTFELLKRFAAVGHSCTWFTSSFPSSRTEKIEDVTIIRRGDKHSVYYKAYRYLQRNNYDLVIDQINTIPFFTPLFYKGKKMAFIHQLCEQIWFYEMPFPLSWIGYISEKIYIRWYRNLPTVVVSASTRKNLASYGFRHIFVMQNAIDTMPLSILPHKKKNSFVFVGRLKKSKQVEDAIKAFSLLSIPSTLHIIGRGDIAYERYLRSISPPSVQFHGYLPMNERNALVSSAEAILVTSVKEGWGLIVSEANALGTPAIVYNVDGLRDAVVDGKTGLVVRRNTPVELSNAMTSFLSNKKLKQTLSENALEHSKTFNWDTSAAEVLHFIEKVMV